MRCPPVTICLVPCTVHVSHEPDNLSIAQPSPRPDFITDRRSTVFVSFTTVSGSRCLVWVREVGLFVTWSLRFLCFCAFGHSAGLFVSRSEVYTIFCKPHNSRDLSWQCVVRWPLPLGVSLTFRIVPLRVQSGRCGHFVLSLGTVRFKQPGMRPTPVPQKKKVTKKKKPKKTKNRAVAWKKMRGVRAQAQQPSPRLPRLPVSPSLAGAQAQ